jgi:hypothetical protein
MCEEYGGMAYIYNKIRTLLATTAATTETMETTAETTRSCSVHDSSNISV